MTWAITFLIGFALGYWAWSMKGRYLLRMVLGVASTLVIIYSFNLASKDSMFWIGLTVVSIALIAYFYLKVRSRKRKERESQERGGTTINIHNHGGPNP